MPAIVSGGLSTKTHQTNGAAHSCPKTTAFFLNTLYLAICSVILLFTVDFYHLLRSVTHLLFGSSSSSRWTWHPCCLQWQFMHLRKWISGFTPELPLSSPVNAMGSWELVNILLTLEPNTFQDFRLLALMQTGTFKICPWSVPLQHQAARIEGDPFFSVTVLSISLLTLRHTTC